MTNDSVETAIDRFMSMNGLTRRDVSYTILPGRKAQISLTKELIGAEDTIYHGMGYEVFTYDDGVLAYDDVLTDEYHCKCCQ